MSSGVKIPRVMAAAVVERVVRELAFHLDPEGVVIAGSMRRDRQLIGDIDLVCALPAPGGDDRLLRAILGKFERAPRGEGLLFSPKLSAAALGWIGEGAAAGFKRCTLMYVQGDGLEVGIEIHRYAPGPMGNRGWIEVLRTGPVEFERWLLTKHRIRQGIRAGGKASEHGFLVDRDGTAIATPTEGDLFRLLGMEFIPPELRDEFCVQNGIRRAS